MALISGSIPFTGPAFPLEEYGRRQERVMEAMVESGIDVLAVTANGHQEYLGGYNGQGGYFAPFPLILIPGRPPTYVVRKYDEDAVRAQSCIDDIVSYVQERDQARACADVLRGMGLERARIGLELGCWNLAPADVTALKAELPELQLVDATRLVARVAAVKSDLELAVMRESMAMTDLGISIFQQCIREGATESEVASAMNAAVDAAGGSFRPYTLVFGARTRLPHARPSQNGLRQNEPAFTEFGAMKDGYVAGLCRTALLGRNRGVTELHSIAEEALEAALSQIRAGVTAGEVDRAARQTIDRHGEAGAFRHRVGYQNGINWAERGNISLEPESSDLLTDAMTVHLPIILFREGEFGVGCSETVVVRPTGHEVLSKTPHALHQVD